MTHLARNCHIPMTCSHNKSNYQSSMEEVMKKLSASLITGALALGMFAGCSKDNATAPATENGVSNVSMSITTGSSLTKGTGINAIQFESAKVLLKNIA